MNIEIPVGLLMVMTTLNIMLLIIIVAGFINPKMVFRELKSRIYNSRVEDKTTC